MALKTGLFVAFFVLATSFMVMAQLQAEIAEEYGATGKEQIEEVGGSLVRAFTVSSFVVIALVTLFGRKLNRKTGCAIAFTIEGLGLVLAVFWTDLATLWVPFAITGMGFHAQFAFLTAMALAAFEGRDTEVVLNRYYLAFGFGFASGPFYLTSLVLKYGVTCKTIFGVAAALLIGFAITVVSSNVKVKQQERAKRAAPLLSMLLDYRLYLLGFAFILYVGAEVSVDVWTKKYLIDTNPFSLGNQEVLARWSGWMVTAFWAGMLIGRSFMGNVAKKYGLIRTLVTIILLSSGVLALATSAHGTVFVTASFVLLGLVMAGTYALIFTIATARFPHHSEDVVSAMVLFTSLGVVLLPQWFAVVGKFQGMGQLPFAFFILLAVLIPVMIHHRRDEKLAAESALAE